MSEWTVWMKCLTKMSEQKKAISVLTWCGFTLFPVSSKIDKLFQRQLFVYYKQTSETFNSFTQNKTLAHRQRLNPDFTRNSN